MGLQTLFANGNSVNFNGANTGDSWNFASNKTIDVIQPTSVDDPSQISSYGLMQNYPNPFVPSTVISWRSSIGSQQTLKIFDVLGNEVVTLFDEWKEVGDHSVNFNAGALASGIYYYKLTTGNFTSTKKMILLR